LKKFFIYLVFALLLLTVFVLFSNFPVSSAPKNLPRLSDTIRIRQNLEQIINTPDYRNFRNVEVLNGVSEFLKTKFLESTNLVSFQEYPARGNTYRNVIASFGPESAPRIIVGAHYDVCLDQDGADDNASGVAGLLELARLLSKSSLQYRIDLVAYSLEEPPDFDTHNMGSYVHAKSLSDSNVAVLGMISLEMISYFSDGKDSQRYPVGFLKWIYGDRGNFITLTQKFGSGKFARNFKSLYFKNNSIPAKSFKAPSFFGGIDLSDHANYWKFGYSALMITNTAFYRNEYYHNKGDKLHRLDIPRMALVIDGVYRSLMAIE
jgi:hypothetical protein